jgi:glycosyltransferase involved in cell wall biosynthesis
MNPKVSVIIPTHNRADLLKEAIQSVLNQTYHNYEIIVIDDGSTDHTSETVKQFPTPISYRYQENSGVSAARNKGIQVAKGDYIAFLDSDDLFVTNKLEMQVAYLQKHQDVGLVYSSYTNVKENLNEIDTKFLTLEGEIHEDILSNCPIATPTVMLRREVLEDMAWFDETMAIAEDIDLWCRIARDWKIGVISEPLTRVRHHQSNTIRDPNLILESHLKRLEKAFSKDSQIGILEQKRLYSRVYLGAGKRFKGIKRVQFIAKAILVYPPIIIQIISGVLRRYFSHSDYISIDHEEI